MMTILSNNDYFKGVVMKKIFVFISIILLGGLVSCNFLPNLEPTTVEVDFTNYIEVENATQLKEMEMNQSYQLVADIDLANEEWIPIGSLNNPFMGNFDGNGYSISNFQITENHLGFNGLFGYITGDVTDLTISGFSIDIQDDFVINAGGLAGMSFGSIEHVDVDGTINVSSDGFNVYVGLLVGNQQKSPQNTIVSNEFSPNEVHHVSVTGTIDVLDGQSVYVGGIFGKTHNTKIYNNEVIGTSITTENHSQLYLGGLSGQTFLYDFESVEPSLLINYDLIYENIVDVVINMGTGDYASVGGLIGYNQNMNILDNFINLSLDIEHDDAIVGMVVGDQWTKDIDHNLAILKQLINPRQLDINTIVGRNQGQGPTGFYSSVSNDVTNNFAVEETIANLSSNDFYQSNYPDLAESLINRIQEVFFD
jgi:hypothetical protein